MRAPHACHRETGARSAARIALPAAFLLAACTADHTAPPAPAEGTSAAQKTTRAPQPGVDENEKRAIKELSATKLPAGAPIAIDGRLDEPVWSAAAQTGPFMSVGTGREDPGQAAQGEARLLWDDEHLYVAFTVRDATVKGGFPPDAKDPHLWERDTVEIMIDPDGDGDNRDYYEIQIGPQNLVFDTQYDDYNAPNGNGKGPFGHEGWSANLVSAVQIDGTIDDDTDKDRGYTVEAKIPWASFKKARTAPPAPGDAWRMNFYAMQNNGGTGWSPIYGEGNFHRARRFGRVRFVAPASAAAAASPVSAKTATAAPSAKAASPPASAKAAAPATSAATAPKPAASGGKAPGFWAGVPDR